MESNINKYLKKDGSPAHIMIITSWYPSVSHPVSNIFVHEQAVALAEKGYKVTVVNADIVSLKSKDKLGMSVRNTDGVNIVQCTLPVYAGRSIKPYIFTVKKATEALYKKAVKKFGKPDLIHIHAARFAGPTGTKIAKKNGVPCVYTEHFSKIIAGTLTEAEKSSIIETIKGSDEIIAVSPSLAKEMSNMGAEAVYIPNILDSRTFNCSPVPHKNFTFVSAGWLSKRKGMDILLQSFKKVNAKYPDTRLKICGSGVEMNNLKQLTEKLGLTDCVSFEGERKRAELSRDLNSSDCFILASYAETFGVVYIEALACGLPVIATKCGGPECIVNSSNGLMTEIGDIDGISKAMEQIYLNRAAYNGTRLSTDCIEKYGFDTIVKQLSDIYVKYIDLNV